MAIRRFVARRSIRRYSGSWPINQLASRAPDGWGGWPEGKRFAFVLTHDVEGRKGLDRCRELAEMEVRLGFRSSFNFVPEGEYETPKSLRDFLTAQGFEIGLHDMRHDGKLYNSRPDFRRHSQRINRYLAEWGAVGFRSAFMLHNFEWLQDLHIDYDASSFDTDPFEPQPDGVNTIFPFWVGGDEGSGYVELPYTLPQDSTLFLLHCESTINTWTRKLDWVAQHGGLALVNVHPDYMHFEGTPDSIEYSPRLYEELLQYVAHRYREECWLALPRDVAAYVRRRNSLTAPATVRPPSVSTGIDSPGDRQPGRTSVDVLAPAPPDLTGSSDWRLHGKRVAMVMFSFYPADPRPRRAVEALVSKGMKVDMICLAEEGKLPKREMLNGVEVLRLPIRRRRGSILSYGYQYTSFLLLSAAILAKRAMTRGYDLVYIHNMPDVLVFSALIPKLFGAKIVLDLHDPIPELMMTIFGFRPRSWAVRLMKRLEKWSIALVDSVVTVNRTCAKLFISRSCPSQKMHVVMNSPDERIFRLSPPRVDAPLANAQNRPFVIMYHGSLVERNGLDLAVDALAQLRRTIPNAILRIYGWSTPYLERVMDTVGSRGLQDAILYLGPKPLEQLVQEIEQCDVGIIPNRRSIFTELNTPTRIFEYLAVGKPVIAPFAAGVSDYFGDDSLIFFELGNAQDLANKIEYVFQHPAEAAQFVRRGQEVFREHNWPVERRRLMGLVLGLLSKAASAGDSSGKAAVPDAI